MAAVHRAVKAGAQALEGMGEQGSAQGEAQGAAHRSQAQPGMKVGDRLDESTVRHLRTVAKALPKGKRMTQREFDLMEELERAWMAPAQPESHAESQQDA